MMQENKHLTQKGLETIVAIKANQNKGWSAFSYVTPAPKYNFTFIPNPFWLAGFFSGSFAVYISDLGRLYFACNLHIRDTAMLHAIHNYLCVWGNLFPLGAHITPKTQSITYTIRNFTFITTVVIPFFNMHAIEGVKAQDFADLRKLVLWWKIKNI
jgi:hypothetical protein